MLETVILVLHIIISILLVVVVMMQTSEGGMGSAFGGSAVYHTKRGIERFLLFFTVFLTVAFSITSIGNVILG